MRRSVVLLAIVMLVGLVLVPTASASAKTARGITDAGVAPGTVECLFDATVTFHNRLRTSGGATGPSKVKGYTDFCETSDSGINSEIDSGVENLYGRITGSFDAGFGTGCTWNGRQAATLTISWRGDIENGDSRHGSKVSYTPSVVSYSGEQVVTDGSGDEGFALPGSANTSSVTGSFASSSDAGRAATAYSSLTPQAIATACGQKKGLKQLELEGAITLGPGTVDPSAITSGPDGALWFGTPFGIDHMTTSGAYTHDTDPDLSATDITTGPDGALWFTSGGGFADILVGPSSEAYLEGGGNPSIDRISPAGVLTSYTDPSLASPDGITTGPDGALWFTNGGGETLNEDGTVTVTQASIGRITTAGVVTNYIDPSVDAEPTDITTGPDGALWFTNGGSNSIGRITTAGAVTIYSSLNINGPTSITSGPDGALWYTNEGDNTIGRITTSGVTTTYSDPSISSPSSITTGPNGALWFTNSYDSVDPLAEDLTVSPGSIGTITTSGVLTNYTSSNIDGPTSITTGPDGALWFTNSFDGTIGRITTSGVATSYG